MNAAGEAQHQTTVHHQAAGAATQQATAAAQEQYAIGKLQTVHVKHGLQVVQVQEIGDYRQIMK